MDNFYLEPPAGLLERIITRIHREERILAARNTALFSITFLGSLAAIIPSLKMLLSDFTNSGFLNFASLAFSDFSNVLAYWQSFASVLLETLPALSLALFLALLLVLFKSTISLAKNVKFIINNISLAPN